MFDRASGSLAKRIKGLPDVVLHLAFSPDGRRLAAALHDDGLRVYDRDLGWGEAGRDENYWGSSYGAAFAPDGRLATTSDDGKVRLYPANLKGIVGPIAEIDAPDGEQPYGIAFNPRDGTRLAVGYADSTAVTLLHGYTLAELRGPQVGDIRNGNLEAVTWSHDSRMLFAAGRYASSDGVPVLAWSDAGAGKLRMLPAGRDIVMSLVPIPDGDLLVAAGDPWLGKLRPHGTTAWTHGAPKADFRNQRRTLSVSSDGTQVGFGFAPFSKLPARFDLAARALALDPPSDSHMMAPRQEGLPIEDWVNTTHPTLGGKPLAFYSDEMFRSLAIHPAGDRFVLGGEWSLRAFDTHGAPLWTQPVPGIVWAVNITGDGRLVVAAYGDGTIRWHRMSDGVELLAFMPLADRTNWVAWTPEGFYAGHARRARHPALARQSRLG